MNSDGDEYLLMTPSSGWVVLCIHSHTEPGGGRWREVEGGGAAAIVGDKGRTRTFIKLIM